MHVRRGNFASLVVTIFLPLLLLSLAAMPLFAQSTSTGTLAGSVTRSIRCGRLRSDSQLNGHCDQRSRTA